MRFWTLCLRLSILDKNVTIQDLLCGVYDLKSFSFLDNEGHRFQLSNADSIKYHELKEQYSFVYKNCSGAPWDVFFFLNNYLFAIQVKSSNPKSKQPQKLNQDMINEEYTKIEEAFKTLKK